MFSSQIINCTFNFQLQCKKEKSDGLHYGLELIHGIQRYNMELCGLKLYYGMYEMVRLQT